MLVRIIATCRAHSRWQNGRLSILTILRAGSGIAFLAALVFGWYFRDSNLLHHPGSIVEYLGTHRSLALAAFAALYAVLVVAAVPTVALNTAAGWLWGPFMGGLISTAGTVCGSMIAFTAARTLFGQPLRRHCRTAFLDWLQREFAAKGWRFVAFVRLNPVFPTGLLNYVFGLTSIETSTYFWASAVFLSPPSFLLAWVGSEFRGVDSGLRVEKIIRLVLVISATLSLAEVIRWGARYLNHARTITGDEQPGCANTQ